MKGHNSACENAKGEKCSCKCNKTLHHKKGEKREEGFETPILKGMGGEVAAILEKLEGKTFKCKDKEFVLGNFVGYEHDGGLADATGKKWWVYWVCPDCKYQWSWHKIEWRIEKQVFR